MQHDTRSPPSSTAACGQLHVTSAEDLIAQVEAARAAHPPVTFYLYDSPVLPYTVASQLRSLEACGTPEKQYHYGGAYWFLRQLLNHTWRVTTPQEAQFLIIPSLGEYQVPRGRGGGPKKQYCRGLASVETMMAAIMGTDVWKERPRDHLIVVLDWEHANPLLLRNTSLDMILRGFVETRWSAPMLRGFTPRVKQPGQFLIAAPYVDNGIGYPLSSLASQWAAEERVAFAPINAPSSGTLSMRHAITKAQLRAQRNVTFFFGGRTSTKIGPGHAQMGYYVRWSLMRQWASEISQRAGADAAMRSSDAVLPSPRHSAAVLQHQLLIIDSDRPKDNPPIVQCTADANRVNRVPRNEPAPHSVREMDLAIPLWQEPPSASTAGTPLVHPPLRRCLPTCSPEASLATTNGACLGRYSPSLLLRTRFALCLRGDIPTSPRPYDAVRYGAIPLIVSDHIAKVGLPFQCWVPWQEMSVHIDERAFMKNAGAALHNLTASLSAASEVRMRALIAHFRRDLLWRHPNSRVAENVLLAAYRWRNRGSPLRGCCPLPDAIVE